MNTLAIIPLLGAPVLKKSDNGDCKPVHFRLAAAPPSAHTIGMMHTFHSGHGGPPGNLLDPWVAGVWDFVRRDRTGQVARFLPEAVVTVSFQYGAPVRIRRGGQDCLVRSFVLGATDQYMDIASTGEVACVVVKLAPGGTRALSHIRWAALRNRVVDARHLWGQDELASFEGALALAGGSAERMDLARSFLNQRTTPMSPTIVGRALRLMAQSGGAIRIEHMAEQLGASVRNLERRFVAEIGLSPKLVARVVRLHRALRQVERGMDWSCVALEAGFSDQAHLTREFQSMLATSPQAFIRRADSHTLATALRASQMFDSTLA